MMFIDGRVSRPSYEHEYSASIPLAKICNLKSLNNIGIQHPFLFQVMRNGILRQQRALQFDFSPHPFALPMRCARRMLATAA